ncbi:60 kDa inner membrane insertion protein [Gluconacetobacter diazotrophicus PA1 5]|uniref:membrane protein insertase YidC n=1 Tax=Gluconacetobacter diazotrophicus TaxID=33996 RepID=UPI000173DB57|nr:membrane protein insertase YidC [Gluconacetobacter diazotrophicus]ACI50150.1 60 kDa inner membrane insertion protein [Gluconacetobacter diazotrophicus PA1 5]TWB08093.1 YidC/Oxa1 family membrane protein insertase [Gluconacetobacter diazotrophicus]
MDTKRFIVATLLSAMVLVGFEYFMPKQAHHEVAQQAAQTSRQTPPTDAARAPAPVAGASSQPVSTPAPQAETRLAIDAPKVAGSIDLLGARLDDMVLRDYHETVAKGSPQVRILEPGHDQQPNYVEIGWMNLPGGQVRVPDATTVWSADAPKLTSDRPVTLSWDNGAGVTFQIVVSIDAHYMFGIEQRIVNRSAQPVSLYPYARVDRAYTPTETGGYLVHEGPISVIDGRLDESSYKSLRTGATPPGNLSWTKGGQGGWAGITDKYWLTAVIPQQGTAVTGSYGYQANGGAGVYQVGFIAQAATVVAPGTTGATVSHVFAGAKEVNLLEQYQSSLHIPDFWKAVDFGWFAFLTRPIFYVLDWLNTLLGNFGLALMAFTLLVKALFFPLATRQFRSMAKMRQLQPKVQELRERYKSDQMALNQNMMALYKAEGVNPAAGCLPMVVQIPVFWSLYKDLYITIEMRHAPFFGWIHDLSAPDLTNLFNLFGLIPWDPNVLSPYLQLGVWPILFGATMFLQQKLNPAPTDPAQQRMFQMMPVLFTFFMARQPAGLVIYYCWNNLLTVAQQMVIQRRMKSAVDKVGAIPAAAGRK